MCRVKLQVDIFLIKKKNCVSLFPGGWLICGRAARGRRKKVTNWGCCRSPCVQPGTVPPAEHEAEGCGRTCVHCPAALVFVCGRGTQEENHTCWTKDEWLAGFGIWVFSALCVVLLMENARVVRCLPGTPRPFRKPCCQLTSALTVSQGHVLAFPGEISCKK